MAVTNALAGVAVKDLAAAIAWYSRLLDRAPDTRPMEELAEWSFRDGGWMQVFEDAGRAGRSSVTLVEDDLDRRLADHAAQDIAVESASTSEMAKVAILRDPDGNLVVFAEALSP
jgi:catechol 2,3-dioxygenase-like lactoylglutathione lyase family enzyme